MASQREIEFDVLREPWNKYSLEDGSYIRSKYILTKFRSSTPDTEGRVSISFDGRPIVVAYNIPESLKGEPASSPHSHQAILDARNEELRYSVISEEWNEYIAEDGSKIRIKDSITRVFTTNLFDATGDPVYSIEHGTLVQGTPPAR